jgi:AraC-like DNA-binding protein
METLVRRLGRILSLKKNSMKAGGRIEPPPSPGLRRMQALERALKDYVDDKGWREPVRTLGEAADRLGTDTRTLHYYFKTRIGQDFRTWRTRLRLEDAKRMLVENPGLHPAEIGRRAGFSNRSNFARQFQAYTGLTPGQWRDRFLDSAALRSK